MSEAIPLDRPDAGLPNNPEVGWTEALGEHATNPPQPRRSGDTVFALDEEWKVSTVENRIRAQFEQECVRKAKLLIQEAMQEGDWDEADRLRGVLLAERGAGYYSWHNNKLMGKHIRAARLDWYGTVYLFYLLLRRCHPDMTLEKATEIMDECPKDCGAAISWALGNSRSPSRKEGEAEDELEKLEKELEEKREALLAKKEAGGKKTTSRGQ